MPYLGLDLTSSPQRETAAVLPDDELHFTAQGMRKSDGHILAFRGYQSYWLSTAELCLHTHQPL